MTRQLALEYEGDLEFIFVVESVEDAAFSVLTQLYKEYQVSPERSGPLQPSVASAPSLVSDFCLLLPQTELLS